MEKFRHRREKSRTEAPVNTTVPAEHQYAQSYYPGVLNSVEHSPGAWPDRPSRSAPAPPPVGTSSYSTRPSDPSTEHHARSPPSPEYGRDISFSPHQHPPSPSESARMVAGMQPDLETSRKQFNERRTSNNSPLQTLQSDQLPQSPQISQSRVQRPQPLESPPPQTPQPSQTPQVPRHSRNPSATSPSASTPNGSSAPSISSSFPSPPISTKPSSFAPSDASSESSEPAQPSANELAKYTMRGEEGRDWDAVLGHLSLRDDRESKFLDVVDEIRSFDVKREFSLPQLVVCGRQSSGKSSVLEALTRVPFPRGDVTCTRFVTEIRLIPDLKRTEISVTVTIRPDNARRDADKRTLEQFNISRGPRDFEKLVQEAAHAMGLDGNGGNRKYGFTQDVLCVEIRGPHHQRLTLVDLPGLIDVNKEGQKHDVQTVEAITKRYIEDKKSIILAVVNADANVQNHTILEKARQVDPDGDRTFGIITKPDRSEAGLANEEQWLKLARDENDYFKFRKGCHVLVNRNGHDTKAGTSSDDRDRKEEAFFSEEFWPADSGKNAGKPNRWHMLFETNTWGVRNLGPRLKSLLFQHTREQIQELRGDIETKLTEFDTELKKLGLGLLNKEQLKDQLNKKLGRMARTTDHAVHGTLRDTEFFRISEQGGDARYLRGRVRDESATFSDNIKKRGHKVDYAWSPDEPVPKDFKGIDAFDRVLKKTMGTELPTNFDPQRITLLFEDYSQPWKGIAEAYVKDCYKHCRMFLKYLVDKSFKDDFPDMAAPIWKHVVERQLELRKQSALAGLTKLEIDRGHHTLTENVQFLYETSEAFRSRVAELAIDPEQELGNMDQDQDPQKARFESQVQNKKPPSGKLSNQIYVRVELDSTSQRKEAAMRMIEQMIVYYKIARDRYVDNVVIQVVERNLLFDLDQVLFPTWLWDEEIFSLVTDDPKRQDRLKERERVQQNRDKLYDLFLDLESLERC